MKIRLDGQKRIQVLVAATFILLGLGVGSLYLVVGRDIDQAREQKRTCLQEILVARRLLEDRGSSRAAVQLIQKKDPALVMDALSRLAMAHNIRLVSLKPSGVTEQKAGYPCRRTNFEAQASGSYKDFGVFLIAVRDMPEGIMDINALNMTADSVEPSRVSARITFTLFEDKGHGQK